MFFYVANSISFQNDGDGAAEAKRDSSAVQNDKPAEPMSDNDSELLSDVEGADKEGRGFCLWRFFLNLTFIL